MPKVCVPCILCSIAWPGRCAWPVSDLSQPFERSANHNANPGAVSLSEVTSCAVHGYAVLKGGKLVASNQDAKVQSVWSVTKTFVATLIGIMIQKGFLTEETTLEVALPRVDWGVVQDADAKKAITIRQILSLSSGLQEGTCSAFEAPQQDSVEEALNKDKFVKADIGAHFYLCYNSIPSYVIFQLTGKTPLRYAQDELFPVLGITRSVVWDPAHGKDNIHESGVGLVLGSEELAKLGVLYQQGGLSGSGNGSRIIPAGFVKASKQNQLTKGEAFMQTFPGKSLCSFEPVGYGYMKWLWNSPFGPVDCAVGHQAQFICTFTKLDLVIAITSETEKETTDYTPGCRLLDAVAAGLDFDGSAAAVPNEGCNRDVSKAGALTAAWAAWLLALVSI